LTERLYNRSAVLTVARPYRGEYFATEPNAVLIRDLRVVFSIEKRIDAQPNTCTVLVYNLNKQSRAEFQRKPLYVTLDVGHDGNLRRIFSGDLRFGSSMYRGTEYETKLTLGDGDRAINHARVNRSFPAGTSAATVLKETAQAMGLRVPKNVADARELLDQFGKGITLHGHASNEMTKILSAKGMQWSLQDGELQILRDTDVRADQAIVITYDGTGSGIESPELAPPDKPGESPRLNAKCLLDSRIRPGGRVMIKSRDLDGLFRVTRVMHEGDTFGEQWTTTIEGTPL
jgi:hypothetical protein